MMLPGFVQRMPRFHGDIMSVLQPYCERARNQYDIQKRNPLLPEVEDSTVPVKKYQCIITVQQHASRRNNTYS